MCSANLTWAKRRKQNASHTLLGKPETILNKKRKSIVIPGEQLIYIPTKSE